MKKCQHGEKYGFFPPPKEIFSRDTVRAGMLIIEIAKMIRNRLRENEQELGIRSGYRMPLFVLMHGDGVSQLELAKMTHLKAPTVSIAVRDMETDGFVERRADSDDKRKTLVYLTQKGLALNDKFRDGIDDIDAQISSALTAEEEQLLLDLLAKVFSKMCEKENEG